MAKIKHNLSNEKIILALFAVLVVVGIVNVIILTNISLIAGQKTETAKPAAIDIKEIYVAGCTDCYDISRDVSEINKQNVNATSSRTEASSPEGKSLIDKYEIRKLPALIVTGEIDKTASLSSHWAQVGTVWDDAIVIEAQLPFYSVAEKRVVGVVYITRIVDTSCAQCTSINSIVNSFVRAGVAIGSDEQLEFSSPQGAKLVRDFGIDQIPAVIVSADILEYPAIAQVWDQLNATEKNGSYALHVLQPPYRSLSENRIVGLVDVIYLNDSTCTNCYNVLVHREILGTNFGIYLVNETIVDINSSAGKSILSKHNIMLVPAFIMSPEAKYYTDLAQVWPSVGTVEKDWYVFRNVTVLGAIYKDLSTGKTIVPAGE